MSASIARKSAAAAQAAVWAVSGLWFGLLAPAASAGGAGLNDTGQSQCSDGSALVACTPAIDGDAGTHPRQDARFGRDAAAAAGQLTTTGCIYPNGSSGTVPCAGGFDFTTICFDGTTDCTDPANLAGFTAATGASNPHGGWSCTFDNVTGLTWALYTGSDVTAANSASLCGYTDWRMPQRHELSSIANDGAQNPAIDTSYFPGTPGVFFLAAEPSGGLSWGVDFSDGQSFVGLPSANAVRPVRGALPAAPSYVDNLDGTITDPTTSLVWDRNAYAGCGTGPLFVCGWQGALQAAVAANQANYLGHSDWRPPSLKELESLVNLASSFPALYPGNLFDPLTASHYFWSSTPYTPNPSRAWGVGFSDGSFADVTSGSASLRLVRDAVLSDATTTTITNAPPLQTTYGTGYSINVSVVRTADSAAPNAGSVACTLTPQPSGVPTVLPAAAVTSGSATCAVPAAQTAGTYRVNADFTGTPDTTFGPSTSNPATLTIDQAGQTLTFLAQTPASHTFASGGTFAINPLATSALPNSGQPIVHASLTTGVCTVSGTTVTIVSGGTCTLAADQAGDTNYSAATEQTQGVTITPATQTIAFTSTPAGPYYSGGTYAVSATGGASGNPVTFSIDAASTPGACAVSGSTVTFTGPGTCIVDADQAGNASYSAAPQVQQTITVLAGPISVPTLSGWALLLLAGSLGMLGVARARRA